jgi:protein-S-isoprenylcysteine O-methyltransferase Ste14
MKNFQIISKKIKFSAIPEKEWWMKQSKPAVILQIIEIGVYLAIFAASIFLSSGNPGWLNGWVFLGINALSMFSISLILVFKNPELLKKRADIRGKRDIDRILAGIISFVGPIFICIIAGMNFRFHWLPLVPFVFQIAGFLLAISGCALSSWAIASNKFFYGFLRIARDDNHLVCNKGPYRFVRHPGYFGAGLVIVAAPLILQSWWAFIPTFLTLVALVLRTKLEDRFLQNGLDGYSDYSLKVRYRLIPLVW